VSVPQVTGEVGGGSPRRTGGRVLVDDAPTNVELLKQLLWRDVDLVKELIAL
jgi:hypothetical protein